LFSRGDRFPWTGRAAVRKRRVHARADPKEIIEHTFTHLKIAVFSTKVQLFENNPSSR
jgi:hypothetical protein